MWSLQGFCRVCVCGHYKGSVEYVYVVITGLCRVCVCGHYRGSLENVYVVTTKVL